MLTCFLAEKGAKCKIVKYVDRIWLKKDSNVSTIMRTFVVDVSPENTKPLEKISFIFPRLVKKSDLENLSYLSIDSKCFVNEENRSTGETNIITENKIIYDDFDCRVDHKHIIRLHSSGKATRIDIDLRNNPIAPGEKELFRLGLNINDLIIELPSITTFLFSYFAIEVCKKDIFNELSHAYDIVPIVPIYNAETLQGGFDIFVYAPYDNEIGSPVSNYNHVSMIYDYKGNLLDKEVNGIRWRLREIVDSPQEEIILGKNNNFSSRKKFQGTVRKPLHFEEIAALKRASIINLIIGIVAAAVGILSLCLYFFYKIPHT